MLPFRLARYFLTTLEYTRDELKRLLTIREADFRAFYSDPHDRAEAGVPLSFDLPAVDFGAR